MKADWKSAATKKADWKSAATVPGQPSPHRSVQRDGRHEEDERRQRAPRVAFMIPPIQRARDGSALQPIDLATRRDQPGRVAGLEVAPPGHPRDVLQRRDRLFAGG